MLKPTPLPSDHDLRDRLRFSSADGLIWLDDQRMLLTHVSAMGHLRKEIIDALGPDYARRLLLRTGFTAGQADGHLARQMHPRGNLHDMFLAGPQLHMLQGAVQVTPETLSFGSDDAPHFRGVFRWRNSWEAETHVRLFGPQAQPVCWLLLGYASGFSSAFTGQAVLFKELQCEACGAAHCRIEGRPMCDWPDGDQMAQDYMVEPMIDRVEALESRVEALTAAQPPAEGTSALIGHSPAFIDALTLLRKAAGTNVTVLLTGETGVGKERFARTLHAMSSRAGGPFVAVNCAAIPAELVESELFGTERGAFTGAVQSRPGRFERADGGTLLLDELGELPLPTQAKLLRVLQEGEIERLGATEPRKVDVRVVAATNVDLQAAVQAGAFRSDLLYRLNVYPIRVPSLREREVDIEPLAQHLLARFVKRHGKAVAGFTDRALDALRHYSWPGNVREMENLIERALILTNADQPIDAQTLLPGLPETPCLSPDAAGQLQPRSGAEIRALCDELLSQQLSLDALQDLVIRETVRRHDGNLAAAARTLGLSRAQVSYRLRRDEGRADTPGA